MSAICEVCGKKPMHGRTVSRLGRQAQVRRVKGRTARLFRPNLQTVRTEVDGTPKRLTVCTSCLKAGLVQRRSRRG